jgi:hypothetical protein
MKSKSDWTREIYLLYNFHNDDNATVPSSIRLMLWYNLNEHRGLRLTTVAVELLKANRYKLYEHRLDIKQYPISSGILVTMDRILKMPWYWDNKHQLTLLDSEVSSMLALCDGNLEQTLKTLG